MDMASTSLLSRVRGLRQAISVLDPWADLRVGRVCARLKARAAPRQQRGAFGWWTLPNSSPGCWRTTRSASIGH
jgi:hypothetical protein